MKNIVSTLKPWLLLIVMLLDGWMAGAQPDRVYRSLDEVQCPDSVFVLQLNRKRLRSIPAEIFTFRNLRVLDLGKNRIDTIPPQIGSLTRLEVLNMQRNRIRIVPPEVGQLTQLRVLNLNRNPILDLPAEMSALTHLEELIIWCTGVISFPPSFAALNYTLKTIDMRVCPMTWDNQQAIEELLPTPRKRWDYVCNCK
jgi:hypothetical protein